MSNLPEQAGSWVEVWRQNLRGIMKKSEKVDPYPVELLDKETGQPVCKCALDAITHEELQNYLQTAKEVVHAYANILPGLNEGLRNVFKK